MEQMEDLMGIPLPASTQWEVVEEAAALMKPVHDELIPQAAQGDVTPASVAGVAVRGKEDGANSGLGKAITYLLRHWKGLTAFLRHAGAPLDNNICEQALKRAVLHRKNALFYACPAIALRQCLRESQGSTMRARSTRRVSSLIVTTTARYASPCEGGLSVGIVLLHAPATRMGP
jgi:hypothetical protein